MNYTKGEWTPIMVGGERRIVVENEEIDEVICYSVRHYNMHLIAAAPDMYEALQTLLPYARGNPLVYEGDIEKAKQALAKAEGK